LIKAYKHRSAATARFPPNITPQDICAAMGRYEDIVQDACQHVNSLCALCGEFGSGLVVIDDHLHSIEAILDTEIKLDYCGFVDNSYQLCNSCLHALDTDKIPKFSAMNAVNVTMCQDYPTELEDHTLMEEYTIARCHPIGTILKLRPNGVRNPAAYNGIRGHIVTIPQNPGPLLDVLPSSDLQFHEHIKIIWIDNTEPTANDLKP
jgi:hypothetical protein